MLWQLLVLNFPKNITKIRDSRLTAQQIAWRIRLKNINNKITKYKMKYRVQKSKHWKDPNKFDVNTPRLSWSKPHCLFILLTIINHKLLRHNHHNFELHKVYKTNKLRWRPPFTGVTLQNWLLCSHLEAYSCKSAGATTQQQKMSTQHFMSTKHWNWTKQREKSNSFYSLMWCGRASDRTEHTEKSRNHCAPPHCLVLPPLLEIISLFHIAPYLCPQQ